MIVIICGEDTVASRKYYQQKLTEFYSQKIDVRSILASEVAEIIKWMGESQSLFFAKSTFITEHINKKIRRNDKSILTVLQKLHESDDVELLTWEDTSSRNLKFGKFGAVKEFKPSSTVFKLLDNLFPSNGKHFITQLHQLTETNDGQFIFTMLSRHIRNLITIKEEGIIPGLQSWQIARLKGQAALWKLENLVYFYEGLYRIDIGMKTGKNAYGLTESLDILAAHFL